MKLAGPAYFFIYPARNRRRGRSCAAVVAAWRRGTGRLAATLPITIGSTAKRKWPPFTGSSPEASRRLRSRPQQRRRFAASTTQRANGKKRYQGSYRYSDSPWATWGRAARRGRPRFASHRLHRLPLNRRNRDAPGSQARCTGGQVLAPEVMTAQAERCAANGSPRYCGAAHRRPCPSTEDGAPAHCHRRAWIDVSHD
jgi:hypothetical protein